MRRLKTAILITLLVLGGFVTLLGLRVGPRYYLLKKFLKDPEIAHRCRVQPTYRRLEGNSPPAPINLGYAVFDVGPLPLLSLESVGSAQTGVAISGEGFEILFMPPHAAPAPPPPALPAGKRPRKLQRFQQLLQTDFLAAEYEIEQTVPAGLGSLLWMDGDEVSLHALKLGQKACLSVGHSEVQLFTTPHSKGIIRIGKDPQDRTRALVTLTCSKGSRNIGFKLNLTGSSPRDIGPLVDTVAHSFRFTVDTIPDEEQMRVLIAQAGIQPMRKRQEP